VAILWLLLPASNLVKNIDAAGMRNRNFGQVYGELLMNSLKPEGLLLTGTDSAYAISMYMKWVEGHRTDISILTMNRLSDRKYLAEALRNAPNIALPGLKDYEEALSTLIPGAVKDGGISGSQSLMRLNAFFAWKIRQRNVVPIYLDEGVPIEALHPFAIPSGLVLEVLPEPVKSIPPALVEEDTRYWDGLEKSLLVLNPDFAGDIEARQRFSKCRSNIGALYLNHEMYPQAKAAFDQAIRFSDRNMEAYAYLALLHKRQGRPEEAITVFGEYMRRDPWNTSARGFYNGLKQ
jgi:tetratricopeptide (TPR) repeat protein